MKWMLGIVRRFALQLICRRARFRFLAAGQINEDHVHPRFDQMRIERERFIKSLASPVS